MSTAISPAVTTAPTAPVDPLAIAPAAQAPPAPLPFRGPPLPDRNALAVEIERQPGGALDPDSWTAPTGDRLKKFFALEPDQRRVDRYAYEWLVAGREAEASGQGGGIHEEFRAGLTQYRDFRRARGEEPFQFLPADRTRTEDRITRERVPFFQKLFTDPGKMAEAFPVEERPTFEARFENAPDPTREKQVTAGVLLVSTMTGRPAEEVAELWPQFREQYGRQVLRIEGDIDDATFYTAARAAFDQEAQDEQTARSIAEKAQRAAIQGKPLSEVTAAGKATTGADWHRFEPAARAGYAAILSEFTEPEITAGRALFEAVATMEGKPVENVATGDGQKAAWVMALESYGAADQPTRDRILALIGLQAQAEGEDLTRYFQRLGKAMESGADMLTTGTGTLTARLSTDYLEELAAKETDPEKKLRMEQNLNFARGQSTFAVDLATAGVKVRRYIDQKRNGFLDTVTDWSVLAAESLPIMAAAAIPGGAGLPAVVTAYAERNLATLRRAAPEASEESILATAYTAGAIEAGIDRLQILTLGARLPRLTSKLMKWGKPGAVAVAAARIGYITAAETAQEIVQNLTLPAVQEIAAALNEDIPGPDWDTTLANEAAALGDTFGVSLIFGIIGGTGSTIMDYSRAPAIAQALQDRDGLALAGYSPATVEEVATTAATNPAAAAEALKAAQLETPAAERRANAEEARQRIEAEAAEIASNTDAGIPTLEKQPDGKIQVNFPDAPSILVDDAEAALEAVRDWETSNDVDVTRAVREYLDFLTDYHASNPEAIFQGRQTTQAPTLETWAGDNKERIAQANARIDIFMRQAGDAMGIPRPLLSDVPILGTSRNVRAGALTRMVAEIHKGGNPLTVIEEAAEAVGKWLMDDSKVSERKMIQWIRTTEQQTGEKILADDLASMDDAARRKEVAEGFSYIARNNAAGRIQDSALPSQVKAFFRAFREFLASALRIAADFAKLRTEGKVDPTFAYWLDVAAGLEPEFQMENLNRQMEEEMLAESMEGFTEIQDAIKGRIPHPDTLKAKGDPLAGEVQRLFDGILNNPASGANQAARTRKARAFFLPPGDMENLDAIRRSVNEQGFAFETPAEMIEAADLSLNYGRKVWGTTDPDSLTSDSDPTFSIDPRPLPSRIRSAFTAAPESLTFQPHEDPRPRIREIARAAGVELVIPNAEQPGIPGDFTAAIRSLGRGLGVEFLFYRGPARGGETGFSPRGNPELIFLNSEPAAQGIPLAWTVAHEVFHTAQKDPRTGARELGQRIAARLTPAEQAATRAQLEAYGYTAADFETELAAFLTGDAVAGVPLFGLDALTAAADIRADILATVDSLASLAPQSLAGASDPTLSITLRTDPLLAAIDGNIRGAERKAEIYRRMRNRVAEVRRRFEEQRLRPSDPDAIETPAERFAALRDLATLEAIAKTLPPAIRGKVVASFRKLDTLKTRAGREAYLLRLLPKIETAIEKHLQGLFREAIRRQFDRAAVKVSDAKTRGGKIGGVAHAIVDQARAAMALEPEQAEATANKLRDQLENAPTLTPEELEELDGKIAALELFADYANADSARLEEALQFLRDIYTEGRAEWLATLAERRAVRGERIATLRAGLALARPIDFQERSRAKRRDEGILAKLNEGFMQWMLSNSQKLRRLGEHSTDPAVTATVEALEDAFLEAELAENDLNRRDNDALALALRQILGASTEYGVAKKLHELTTAAQVEIPVSKIEGFREESVTVPKNLVESILRGEVSGFTDAKGNRVEIDALDLAALEKAWDAFTELDETTQNRRRVLTFDRRVSNGQRKSLGQLNQLEALQIFLTMRQPDQAQKMETLGFDAATMAELEAFLRPETKALGNWMVEYLRAEQGTIDALHRAEKGVGLGLVENYFPVRNDVSRADNGGLSLDGQPAQQGGRSVAFIKERVANYANPAIVNALAVFLAHRSQANFWRSHVAAIREWSGVIRDDGFASAVKTRMGETYYQSLTRTLDRIESGGSLNAGGLSQYERALKGLLKTFALGTLGMRVSTIMVNATAAMNVFFEIPARRLVRGALEIMKRPEAFRDAWNSPPIRRRLEEGATFEARLGRSTGPSDRPALAMLNEAANKGMFPINLVDTGTNLIGAAIVWEETRANAIRAGVDPDTARTLADAKVEKLLLRSAQPTTRLARSEFEQRVLDNPLAAFFALFVSEPRKNAAITYLAVRELATGKGTYGKAMAAQQAVVGLAAYLAAEFLVRSLFAAFAKAEDDEEETIFARFWDKLTDAKAWSYALATSQLRGVPVLGEFWGIAMAKTFDQRAFDKSPNPLLKLTTLPGNIEALFDGTTEEQTKAATRIIQTLGTVIPGGSVAAQAANVADFAQGLATSNGVSFSDEDRARRLKSRFEAYRATLDEIHGPTTREDGRIDATVQAAKWTAQADRLRTDLAPASPELRRLILDSIKAPATVKDRAAAGLETAPPPPPATD